MKVLWIWNWKIWRNKIKNLWVFLSPSKDGHFEILGKISNVSKNAKVYYGNNYKFIK